MPKPALNNIAIQFIYEYAGLASIPPSLMSLYFVKIRKKAKITNPLAIKIIIQPRYFDKKACKSRKNDSDISEFNDTTAVINDKSIIEIRNLGLLKLFIEDLN